ncbi:protein zyg-11 homolog B-like isoform X2 [Actinia tenebrosa]|uniref:Protein zyg-11 homolog B-like isoform X2 n=1 Tax=Actinia tenebrosa TaxID=6105 RepID=A0A6P8H4S7_ACTTE|nr:protein zyg-11 homolog B-like isoform X2 [Actinia tenebrosa]
MTSTFTTESWNTLSPLTLEDICLDFICKNIENLTFEVQEPVGNFNKLAFKVPVFLHERLAEAIVRQLASTNRLTLKVLTLFLDKTTCRLKRACIQDSNIREIGLRLLLMHHTITDLDLRRTEITFSLNVISSLEGYECTSFLKRLNISSAKNGLESSAVCSFKNLIFLDISKNSITDADLKVICDSLKKLEELNISCNPICEVESFGTARQRLKSLKAYNCPVAWNNPIDFAQFKNLRHLDISRKPTRHMLPGDDAEKLEMLLSQRDALKDLEVLDISGTQRVMDRPLEVFLSGHPKLTFLGLCKTGSSYADFLPKDIEITGEATEQQILSSLQNYPDRASYMTESLSRLFHISKNWTEQRFEILQYVLPPMEMHPQDLRMQMASTACIFNLTRSAKNQYDLHPTILGKIASLVLKAMSSFTNKHELIRNCLLILDSPLMLRYAKFDYYEACMSAMDALCQFINDLNIVRLATKICAVLTAKISNYETIALGTDRHFKTLLNIVKDKVESQRSDYVLSLTLSVLWNLTDDAQCTCQLFVDGQGLKLFIQVLKEFGTENVIVKKVLGTLNNVAEVDFLRPHLLTDECVGLLRKRQYSAGRPQQKKWSPTDRLHRSYLCSNPILQLYGYGLPGASTMSALRTLLATSRCSYLTGSKKS